MNGGKQYYNKMSKMKLDPYHVLYKRNLQMDQGLEYWSQNYKTLERKCEEKFHNIEFNNYFLDITPKP